MMNKLNKQSKSKSMLIIVAVIFLFTANNLNAKNSDKQNSQLLNIGQPASKEEIAGWDIDVRPDGHGLPDGGATASDGEDLYDEKCASCHGTFGEGEASWPKLIGEKSSIKTGIKPEKTVGTFWASPSTLLDYVHRAMPFTEPQSLSWDETWAISAYVLYLNDIIDEDFLLNRESFFDVKMPNAGNFIADQRPDVKAKRCMKNCKKVSDISVKVALLGYASGAEDSDQYQTTSAESLTDELNKNEVIEVIKPYGEETYIKACALCHDQGVAGAPKIDDKEKWLTRLNQGIEQLYSHANKGFQGSSGFMPAKGGQSQLTDKQVNDAVEYILIKNNVQWEKK